MDEAQALEKMHQSQRQWRMRCKIGFIFTVVVSSFIFITLPNVLPGFLFQTIMVASMLSVFGLVFLDQASFQINKKFYPIKDILNNYLFKHSKAEDIHKAVDVVVELIKDRRALSQEKKTLQ